MGWCQGESSDGVWLQPPVPGHSWARQHTLGRSVHSQGWLVVPPALPQAGASRAGASRSLHFLHQQTQRQPGLMEPPEPLPAAPHRYLGVCGQWHCIPPVPCPPFSSWGWWCLPCQALQLCLWSCQLDSHHSSGKGSWMDVHCLSDGAA